MSEFEFPKTAYGIAKPATPEDIAKEESVVFYLATDDEDELTTDSGDLIARNVAHFGYTHPNLHRRIDPDPVIPPGSDYLFVKYRPDGTPYDQSVVIGVWDGLHSYRTTTTYIHDEESTTCEIP